MCSYITETTSIVGSAKGASGWTSVDRAHVYYDHPFHAPLDHALMIDFVDAKRGGERVAVELSADSARELVATILKARASGEDQHAAA
jgi:hypothetical protein